MYISYSAKFKELKTYILLKIGARKSPGGTLFLHLFHTLHSILPGGPFVNCCAVDSDTFFHVISAHSEYPPSSNITPFVILENFTRHFLVEILGPCLCCVLFCLHLCCGSLHLVMIYLCFSLCNGLWATGGGGAVHFHLRVLSIRMVPGRHWVLHKCMEVLNPGLQVLSKCCGW